MSLPAWVPRSLRSRGRTGRVLQPALLRAGRGRASRGALCGAVTVAVLTASLVGCEAWLPAGPTGLPQDTTTQEPGDTLPTLIPLQAWLDSNSATIRSTSIADDDFSDLAPLVAAIGDSRVVMLGSPTRHDGSASEAQSRLVRFLHEEMDFNVLAFESSLFDVAESWARIQDGASATIAGQAGVASHWGATEEVQPLFAYVGDQANGVSPLVLAGFAPEFTGTQSGTGFGEALDDYLTRFSSPLLQDDVWAPFRSVVGLMAAGEYDTRPMSVQERASFAAGRTALTAETNRLINIAPRDESGFWFAMTNALNAQARVGWALEDEPDPDQANAIRDSSLAESIVWLAQARYPEEKLIVWTTSNHTMRSRDPLTDASGETPGAGLPVVGQLVRVPLGDQVYSLALLAGDGAYGPLPSPATQPIRPLVAPPPESWGGLFLATGKPITFLDLRPEPVDVNNSWVYGARLARALNYQLLQAQWGNVFDGFFYVSTMRPSTPLGSP